jgi:uncharacterized membrane protein (DUF4010 family)
VRTFLIVALLGVLSAITGGPVMSVAMALAVAGLAVSAYLRDRSADPGMTTEVALLATFLLGVLSDRAPMLAAGTGVLLAAALAARERLHRLVRRQLSEQEVHDGLLLAACAMVVLPLMPDRALDSFGAFNPRTIWKFTVLVMAMNSLGYLALRVFGARRGLALAGLAAGFISSSAAHAAMGARARSEPALRGAAAAGAAWSSVATFLQLQLVLAVVSPPLLAVLFAPLLAALAVCIGAALLLSSRAAAAGAVSAPLPGRAFRLHEALLVGATIAVVLLGTGAASHWLGERYALATIAIGGFADVHSATAAVGALFSTVALAPNHAGLAVLLAVAANTVTKLVLAYRSGGARFALALAPGLLLAIVAAVATGLLRRPAP